MSPLEEQPATETAPLSQWQRVTNTFSAPSKTFADIKRGNKSWWMPWIIGIVFAYLLFGAITLRIGWPQVAENAINLNPKSQERLAQAPPQQRDMTMKITRYSIEGGFAAGPALVLIFALVISGVMLGTINFIFGGKATFASVFAVWFYASLPGIIKTILGTIVIFSGLAPESFNIANFAPTSVGAFLNPQDVGPALYKLASAIDFTTIWYLALLGIGLSVVAGVKRSSGYIAVFGWWAVIVLVSVGWAAAFG
ncbi:MAG TPA: YIP1 family protein [Terracidiphilus sp.]|nr:YIP1 family protein [Terracidiphilus sp.]